MPALMAPMLSRSAPTHVRTAVMRLQSTFVASRGCHSTHQSTTCLTIPPCFPPSSIVYLCGRTCRLTSVWEVTVTNDSDAKEAVHSSVSASPSPSPPSSWCMSLLPLREDDSVAVHTDVGRRRLTAIAVAHAGRCSPLAVGAAKSGPGVGAQGPSTA